MISYLLSGWRVFVPDANGQPLYRGRVYFYDASTSEPSAVYQEKEKVTSLGTYVDVDNHGFLPPIWLDSSHLYKCVVKRLIQNDPETWQTLWEIDDVGNPFITSDTDDGSSTIMVNDIALLRSIDVTSDERPDYVSVAGWFNPGDTGSPMVFCWREGEVHNEDGHWVKPNSSASIGTWEQILDDELDPRKFGAIPDTGNAVDSALVNCMRYACEPHVHDISDPTVYKPRTVKFVRSGNYKLNGNFDFADYSMIPAFGSTPVPVVIGDGVYFDGTAEFGQGARIESSQAIGNNFIIKDKETHLRTSWYGNKLNIVASSPRVIVIDDDIGSTTLPFTGKVIINLLDTLPFNLMLTDCVVIDAHDGSLAPTKLRLGDYLIDWIKGSGGTLSRLNFKYGGNNVMKFDGSFAEFINTLGLPEGFQVDNDNFLMRPEGENEKYISLKIKALLDLTSKTGTDSGIKFDRINVTNRARINRVVTDYIEPSSNASIAMAGGIRRAYSESTVIFSSWGNHDLGLLSNFSTTSKFNIVIAWAWNDSSSTTISDYVYLEGANGKSNLEIICIENCGPKEPNYEPATLARDGDFEKIADKSGPLYILGGPESGYTNKIIDVIPPFSRKHFMWLENEGRWVPVSV